MINKSLISYLDNLKSHDTKTLKKFFERFEYLPSCVGKDILDFGCGRGLMSLKLLEMGAKRVTGIDVDPLIIDYAKREIPKSVDRSRLDFFTSKLENFREESFDLIFSKDTLEHCLAPSDEVRELARLLRPGGKLILGFGPLWFSMFGDHQILKTSLGFSLPWLHLILPENVIVDLFNNSSMESKKKVHKFKMNTINEYLNQKTILDYENALERKDLDCLYKKYNAHENRYLDLLGQVRVPPLFRQYWVRNMYAIYEKI